MTVNDLYAKKTNIQATTVEHSRSADSLIMKIQQEFKDRSRKDIQKWRRAINAAENPEEPRWHLMQDLIDNLIIDAHLASVIGVRKASTLNNRFYVIDKKTSAKLDEQSEILNRKWFYDFVDFSLDAIARKYAVMQLFRDGSNLQIHLIPHRNVCPQLRQIYKSVNGNEVIDYSIIPNVIEVQHSSPFGLINDVAVNVIMKVNLMQSNAEFSERFGMPLISAVTANRADVPRIEQGLKNLGEAGTGVLPTGADIKIHSLANAGNPEKVYLEPMQFHDKQISKRFLGSTTIIDESSNRSQTEIHKEILDDKITTDDKRFISFIINDKLFPILQNLGFPFNNETMLFQFDETEDLTLTEHWKITYDALNKYDLDIDEVRKTFNLPIIGKREDIKKEGEFSANFQ